jgi:hypothetical protein
MMTTTNLVASASHRRVEHSRNDNALTKDNNAIYISGRRTAWKEQLIDVLSRYCGCTYLIEKDHETKSSTYYLVGRKSNITQMRALWVLLSASIHEEANTAARGNGRIVINSFCLGFVEGLKELVETSAFVIESTKMQQEAKHYMRLTHYEVPAVCSYNNSHIDEIAFQCGKMRGQTVNLIAVGIC